MNKRGQFYLIAAVVLAAVLLGIATISNYSKKEMNPSIDELKEEIQIESQKTLDYGINTQMGSPQISSLMQNFTNQYTAYEGRGNKNLYFLFGTTSSLTVAGFQDKAKIVSVSSGSSNSTITQNSGSFSGSISPGSSTVRLSIDGDPYTFNLKSAENFYFVLTEDLNGGEYIVTG